MTATETMTPAPSVLDRSGPAWGVRGGRSRAARYAWLLVAAAVVWNLVALRDLLLSVPYLNDSSMHEQMVRFASAQWRAGQLPLTSWFPFLGEGSPQFLHYQSLPAMLTGAVGLVVGPDSAFRWSLYLLLSSWPLSIYLAARAFGASRVTSAATSLLSPFLVSVTGVGYEQHAYVWIGFGVWTQLWAMWTLPLAWGFSWQTVRGGQHYLRAVLLTALTTALHFETGYLALAVLIVWPVVCGSPFLLRARRAASILLCSLLSSAWVIVPLLQQRNWAAINQPLQGTGLVNGYGAPRVLTWLVSGQLLDHGRLPVITLLMAVGLALACRAWASDANSRGLLIALGVCLLLASGRTTLGGLINVIPGSKDIFFRRFMMGIQLAALLLAGRGAGWLATSFLRVAKARPRWPRPGLLLCPALVVSAAVLSPAWLQLAAFYRRDDAAIAAQRHADAVEGAQLDRLLEIIRRDGGGRAYAGLPSNWGKHFTVGQVPVFKYLESRDIDEVGYALRTASLMTDPEYYFDDKNLSDYRLFGIRYLIVPTIDEPPAPAQFTASFGPYALWEISGDQYVQAGRVTGRMAADRADIGESAIPLLHSGIADNGSYLAVRYGTPGHDPTQLPSAALPSSTGTIIAQHADLTSGRAIATVRARQPGVVVLSASYDPGWTAKVNRQPEPIRMVAPALVAVNVGSGTSHVTFQYHGYRFYPELFSLAGCVVMATAFAPIESRRRRRSRERTRAPLQLR